jgi:hypothetical protein
MPQVVTFKVQKIKHKKRKNAKILSTAPLYHMLTSTSLVIRKAFTMQESSYQLSSSLTLNI